MAKKRKTKVKKKEKINECEGWSIGDYAWALYVDGSIVEGEVVDFYPKDNHGPCAAIQTVNRGIRTVLIEKMKDKKITKKRATTLKKK